MFKSFKFILPFTVFLVILLVLKKALALNPSEIPSPLINQPAPAISIPLLFDEKNTLSNKDFLNHVTLVSFWASWCETCVEENNFLMQLKENKVFQVIGIDYKDPQEEAEKWLEKQGSPYKSIGIDATGKTAIDFGVYGTPETFIIDKKGIIRYKQIGIITPEVWEKNIRPLIEKLQNEMI